MALLYYWRGDNYRRDLDLGAGYHLNQGSPRLHDIEIGDSLWAFTRLPDGRYVLAAELVVQAKTFNPPRFRYGRYRLWGDLRRSRYFAANGQANVEQVIRRLSIRPQGDPLGRSFQGHSAVRRITRNDHQLLAELARGLPLEPRARLLPEERLEALVLLGDPASVERLLMDEPSGIAAERARYLYKAVPRRNPALVRELRDLYEGRCQVCLWAPRDIYGPDICEAHHLTWLSRGGLDELTNLALLCPNHHRAVHLCDAAFDFESLSFDFGEWREGVRVDGHLRACQS